MRAFAAQVFVVQPFAAHMALGQASEAVGLVHFQHIALQHGVVRVARHLNAVVGHDVAVVFDVLAQLLNGWVFKPRFELDQHFIHRQLHGCIAIAVRQRDVAGLARFDRKAQTHNLGAHGVE